MHSTLYFVAFPFFFFLWSVKGWALQRVAPSHLGVGGATNPQFVMRSCSISRHLDPRDLYVTNRCNFSPYPLLKLKLMFYTGIKTEDLSEREMLIWYKAAVTGTWLCNKLMISQSCYYLRSSNALLVSWRESKPLQVYKFVVYFRAKNTWLSLALVCHIVCFLPCLSSNAGTPGSDVLVGSVGSRIWWCYLVQRTVRALQCYLPASNSLFRFTFFCTRIIFRIFWFV